MIKTLIILLVLALLCLTAFCAYHIGRIDMDNEWMDRHLARVCALEYPK